MTDTTTAKKRTRRFAHLHVHSEFSMLDGLGTVDHYVERARQLGQPALALTDHGNLCGAPSFYRAARKADIEPIIGEEFYFVEDAGFRPAKGEALPERHHVVILARGQRGYEVLSELSTESHRNFYYKPLLDVSMVESLGADADHLVALSGCATSVISHAVRDGDEELARQWTQWWREAFPHFYIELQHHDTDFDLQLNTGLIKLARKYRIPHVVTNDPHYVIKGDHEHHDTLLAIQTASDRDDPERFRFDGSGYHLRSRAEMARVFKQNYALDIWTEGAKRTLEVAKLCHTRIPQWETRTWHIPKFEDVEDSYAELKRLTYKELRNRGWAQKPEYRERVVHELKAIKQVGIADFLLITRECIVWAEEQGITVGPGRGSVCGTLVGFLIGIHKIDPVKYDLLFERFLNPARPKMPDIDTDFEPSRRHELFEHVAEKYGDENCVHVAAYQNMKLKAAFRSLAKAFGVSYVDANRLGKMLPDASPDEGDEDTPAGLWPPKFKKEMLQKYPDMEAVLRRLEGVKRALAAHPAGVVIAAPDDNIKRLVPQMWLASGKRLCGQYDLEAVEDMGLMKQDFLGLRTLETIRVCCDLIEDRTGRRLDPDSWVPDEEKRDRKVYAMLARGETSGVFQMEGPVNKSGVKQIKPTCFEDIVTTTALYRTGAISAGFPKICLANRKVGDPSKVEYEHESLRPILSRTWGVVLYQEQVMEMGLVCAGFDQIQVDDIKEAIKHKKSELMQSMGPLFIKGCMKTVGMSRQQAENTWKMIEGYSGYGYNRSHAVAYTFLTYQTARLRALYEKEFTCALLRTIPASSAAGKEKRTVYLGEAARMGLDVAVPDINESDTLANVTEDGIRFGFEDISGIGPAQARKIVDGRPEGGYETLEQVQAAVRNEGVVRALSEVGALVPLGIEGSEARATELLNWRLRDDMEEWRDQFAGELRTPEDIPDLDDPGERVVLIGRIDRKFVGKTKTEKPYLTWHVRWSNDYTWNVRLWSETEKSRDNLWDLELGDVVMVTGQWEQQWENVSVGSANAVKVIWRASDASDSGAVPSRAGARRRHTLRRVEGDVRGGKARRHRTADR